MGHSRGNQDPVYVAPFQIPASQEDFDALTYPQRVALKEQRPRIYDKYAHGKERDTWKDSDL